MVPHLFSRSESNDRSSASLIDGSRVAVIGGGPAGSFFSYFLLDLAERVGIDLKIDIYEPRDFSLPAPQGCNICAGVISETLVQNLAAEGINLPTSVIQKAINSYVLHTDLGIQQIEAPSQEKRIGALFRGAGPHGIQKIEFQGLDSHLLSLAEKRGANIIHSRVTGVDRVSQNLRVTTRDNTKEGYDLLAVATGVNTAAVNLFEGGSINYSPPKTSKTAIREYSFRRETIEKYFGDSLHVFLLDIPRLDFAMIVPKSEYVSVCLLGKDIDGDLIQTFLTAPEVASCFPDGWRWDKPECHCLPRINVRAAFRPYADRVVFVGDSSVTRLYKDGIGAAYRAAKAAAACAVLEGISFEDFRRYYAPFCKTMERDNLFGTLIFFITHIIQGVRFSRKAVLSMLASEQHLSGNPLTMSSVLWDTFTGNAPYREIFLRMLHPAFASRFARELVSASVER